MLQFEISDSARLQMLKIIKHYGKRKAEKIADAYDSIQVDLKTFPGLVPLEGDGHTRILHRAEVMWIYEVLEDRIRLLNVLDPRQNLDR